jgi:hypothetical protein
MTSELFKNTKLSNQEISDLTKRLHGVVKMSYQLVRDYRLDQVADPKIKHLITLMRVLEVEEFKWNAGFLSVRV